MVQALICAQDWLKLNTRIDMDDYFDELRKLENGNLQCLLYFCLRYLLYYIILSLRVLILCFLLFVLYILIILDLTKLSLNDNAIDVGVTLNN